MTEKGIKTKVVSSEYQLFDFQQTTNDDYVLAKCRIAYAGKNRNGSKISREAFEKAEKSLINVPVVGNWLGDNFGGHDIIMETQGNEFIIKNKAEPIGFVPESTEITWEEVTDKDGNMKLYQTCDVVLWKGRKPEEVEFIMNNGANHSMEISVMDYDWGEDDYIDIKEFKYHALCVLGKDESDPDKDVEPCFEDAGFFSKEFNQDLKKMISNYSKTKGGKGMSVDLNKKNAELELENEKLIKQIEEFKNTNEELADLVEDYKLHNEGLTEEVEELKAFKLKVEEKEKEEAFAKIREQYSALLSEEVIEENHTDGISVEQFETNLSLVFAKAELERLKAEKEELKDKTEKFSFADTGLSGAKEVKLAIK